MTDYMAERASEKDQAVEAIKGVFTFIERERRAPDSWEENCLAEAIGQIERGLYGLALSMAEKALTPVARRSPASADVPSRFDLQTLRQEFEKTVAAPVLERRYFC